MGRLSRGYTVGGAHLGPPGDGWTVEAARLKAQGKMIHAVKLVRERTGLSLADAKDFVDRL